MTHAPSPLNSLEQVAEAHARAWQELAASASAVVNLPLRTFQHLAGIGALEPPVAHQAREVAHAEEILRWQKGAVSLEITLERTRAEHAALVSELRRTYLALERDVEQRVDQARDDQKRSLYGLLEPLLTQLPVARRAMAQGLPVEAHDVIALLGPLDDALAWLGFAPIGAVGVDVPFDPSLHQISLGAPPDAGQPVTVKHVGYTLDARILRKARVTRKPRPQPNVED